MENNPKKLNLNFEKVIPIDIPLIVRCINLSDRSTSYIGVELRKQFTNNEIIKILVWCALNNIPIRIQPKFHDTLKSISSLLEKGILYRDEKTGELKFTI